MSVTTTIDSKQDEKVEVQRTEILVEEQKLSTEPRDQRIEPVAATAKASKKVRWYEGYRAGYFC